MSASTPPVDQSKITELIELFGDQEEVKVLFDEFFADLPERLTQLRNGVEQNACTDINHAAHAIKGSSSSLGAIGVEDVARTLETQARGNCLVDAEQLVDRLESELQSLRSWLAENGLLGD